MIGLSRINILGNKARLISENSSHLMVLLIILSIALTLGVIGLDHGLPYGRKVDEYRFAETASKIAANNHPNPGWFGHPGSTLIYPLAVIYKIWGSISYEIPVWQENPELRELVKQDIDKIESYSPSLAAYYLMGRGVNVLYFVVSVGLIYLFGRQIWNERIALLAAWFMATCYILLYYAQILRTDLAGLLFYLLAMWTCIRLFSSCKWYDYVIAGLAIGLAGSSRYFGFSLGAILILAHFMADNHHEHGHWKRLTIGVLAIPFGFLISTPAFVFALDIVYRNFIYESRSAIFPLTPLARLWWYLTTAFPDAISWPIWLLGICGIMISWRQRNRKAILVSIAGVIYLTTILVPSLYHQRWIVTVVPLILLFAAQALWTLIDALKHRSVFIRHQNLIVGLVILLFSLTPLVNSIQHTYVMTQPNTQTLAAQWIAKNLPNDSRIARELNTGCIPNDDLSITFSHRLYELGPFDEVSQQYDYFVTSSSGYSRCFQVAASDPKRTNYYQEPLAFYKQLFKNELVAEFNPDPWKTVGPTIRVYKMN